MNSTNENLAVDQNSQVAKIDKRSIQYKRKVLFDCFSKLYITGEALEMTMEQLANKFKVSRPTIYAWKGRIDWDFVKTEARRRYSDKALQIDGAVFKAALKGDIQAAKLWFERFDGWVPTSQVINGLDKSDSELLERAKAVRKLLEDSVKPRTGQDSLRTGEAATT